MKRSSVLRVGLWRGLATRPRRLDFLEDEQLSEAVTKHVHDEARLYPDRAAGTATRFALGCTKPLTTRQGSPVNVAVNENPAKPCSGLPCRMPADQHHYSSCSTVQSKTSD